MWNCVLVKLEVMISIVGQNGRGILYSTGTSDSKAIMG